MSDTQARDAAELARLRAVEEVAREVVTAFSKDYPSVSPEMGSACVRLRSALPDPKGRPVIALRNDDKGELDDVVAKDVRMFRAEMMGVDELWMACYFDYSAEERLTFYVRSKRGRLEFGVTERPSDFVDYDTGVPE